MLTTVWKREINELRVGFGVRVRDLPPRRVVGPPHGVLATPSRAAPDAPRRCPGSSMIGPVSVLMSNLVGDPESDPVFDPCGDPVSDPVSDPVFDSMGGPVSGPVSPVCAQSLVSALGGLWESLGLVPLSDSGV